MQVRNGFLSLSDLVHRSRPSSPIWQPFPGAAWREIFQRFGVVLPVVVNQLTGNVLFLPGALDVLHRMYDANEAPPKGVRVDVNTGRWYVPAFAGEWSRQDERYVTAICGGGVDFALFPALTSKALFDLLLDVPENDFEVVTTLGIDLDEYDEILAAATNGREPDQFADAMDAHAWGIPALLMNEQALMLPERVVKWGTVARTSEQPGALYHFYRCCWRIAVG